MPAADLGFKAELHLRKMVELSEIRNELFITGDDPPAARSEVVPPVFLPPPAGPGLPATPAAVPPPLVQPLAPVPAVVVPRPTTDEVEVPTLRLPKGK